MPPPSTSAPTIRSISATPVRASARARPTVLVALTSGRPAVGVVHHGYHPHHRRHHRSHRRSHATDRAARAPPSHMPDQTCRRCHAPPCAPWRRALRLQRVAHAASVLRQRSAFFRRAPLWAPVATAHPPRAFGLPSTAPRRVAASGRSGRDKLTDHARLSASCAAGDMTREVSENA